MNIESELKLIPGKGITREQIVNVLKQLGIVVPEEGKIKHQEDTYFDDKEGALGSLGESFRIRRKKDEIKVTYKMPKESDTAYNQRREYEIKVPEEYKQNIDMELAIRLLKEEYPELSFPENMGEIVTVINDRNKTNITCPDGTIIEMAFDSLKGKDENGYIYPVQSEIEFETISGNPENLTTVYEAVLNAFPDQIQKNALSKYARTKKEVQERKITLDEVAACAIFSQILNSTEFDKLQYKGQILNRYDKPTLTNLDNFKDFGYLVETIRRVKSGEYQLSIPKKLKKKKSLIALLKDEEYEFRDKISLEEMVCLLLSDVKYGVADEVLVEFLNTNYYGKEHPITNRLSHSQQIMLGSGLIAKSSEVGASFEERLISMISGLSHDIGHVPMAHALEGLLNEMDGLFSHELNGKITIDNIYEQCKEDMILKIKTYFPDMDEQTIRDTLESKTTEIKSGVVNHSRKGSENRISGINNQAARVSDKLFYSVSDVCDLVRFAQTVLGKEISILDDEWIKKTIKEICGNNEELAEKVQEKLEKKYIKYLRNGKYGRAIVNSINSIEGVGSSEKVLYEVDQKVWKFMEALIKRVKDVREEMGIEQGIDEKSKAAMIFVIEELYKEYIQNSGDLELSWDNLLKTITKMGELDLVNYIRGKNGITLEQQLRNQETITPEQANSIIQIMGQRVLEVSKNKGMTEEQAREYAESIKNDLQKLSPEQVFKYFRGYSFLKTLPIIPIIDQLHNRADIQLKIKPGPNVSLSGIWRDLKIKSKGSGEAKSMVDQYYRVKYKGEIQKEVSAKIRHVDGENFKTLIVKVPIEKNVSERMKKQFSVSGALDLSVEEMMQELRKANVGLDIELVDNEPYECLEIQRMSFIREYDTDQIVFSQDIFKGKETSEMQEIEISCPSYPKKVGKIRGKLGRKYRHAFVTGSKIDRVEEDSLPKRTEGNALEGH